MAIRPNQHRTISVYTVRIVPIAVAIDQIAILTDLKGRERRPGQIDRPSGPFPRIAATASEQHEARAEQVKGRDLLVDAFKPDMGRAAARPRGWYIIGDGVVDD